MIQTVFAGERPGNAVSALHTRWAFGGKGGGLSNLPRALAGVPLPDTSVLMKSTRPDTIDTLLVSYVMSASEFWINNNSYNNYNDYNIDHNCDKDKKVNH